MERELHSKAYAIIMTSVLLGGAVNDAAIRRQIRILKDMGCNAIRTSHNMPAPGVNQSL